MVMYDPLPQMYTVVAEIKSGDAERGGGGGGGGGGGLEQNVEQMLVIKGVLLCKFLSTV